MCRKAIILLKNNSTFLLLLWKKSKRINSKISVPSTATFPYSSSRACDVKYISLGPNLHLFWSPMQDLPLWWPYQRRDEGEAHVFLEPDESWKGRKNDFFPNRSQKSYVHWSGQNNKMELVLRVVFICWQYNQPHWVFNPLPPHWNIWACPWMLLGLDFFLHGLRSSANFFSFGFVSKSSWILPSTTSSQYQNKDGIHISCKSW